MPLDFVLTLAAVFLLVALLSASATSLALACTSTERRLIRRLSGEGAWGSTIRTLTLTDAPSSLIKRLQLVVPKSPRDMSRLRRRLTAAGYRSASAAPVFAASELLLAVACPLAVVIVQGVSHGGLLLALFAAAVRY